mmetsp:Transcript_44558/g.127759  ORF Transcript_44558/g.127759 Transcript_44558/m.127759 type:complete len:461 (+) Transcript_44558:84-1466(+)
MPMLGGSCLAELLLPAAIIFSAHLCIATWETITSGQAFIISCVLVAVSVVFLFGPWAVRAGASLKAADKPPKEAPAAVESAPEQRPAPAQPAAAAASPSRSRFGQCFPFLDSPSKKPARRADASASSEPAAGPVAHPKFCGLRWARPPSDAAGMPACGAFEPEPLGGPMPEAWEAMLGHRGDELRVTRRLREAVVGIAGPKDPVTMLRFLRARGGDVAVAAKMYRSAMDERVQPGVERAFRFGTVDDSLHQRLDAYWKPMGLLGFDRDGDPVLWERIGVAPCGALARIPAEFLLRHEVYTMARIQQSLDELMVRLGRPIVYFTAVEDLTGLGLQHLNPRSLKNYQALVRFCEDNYPEMVKRALVIKAPGIFARIWKLVKHFFDKGTRDKIQIVGARDTYDTLCEYIDPEWIPECYGGKLRVGTNEWCEPVLPRPAGGIPEDLLQEVLSTWARIAPSLKSL